MDFSHWLLLVAVLLVLFAFIGQNCRYRKVMVEKNKKEKELEDRINWLEKELEKITARNNGHITRGKSIYG